MLKKLMALGVISLALLGAGPAHADPTFGERTGRAPSYTVGPYDDNEEIVPEGFDLDPILDAAFKLEDDQVMIITGSSSGTCYRETSGDLCFRANERYAKNRGENLQGKVIDMLVEHGMDREVAETHILVDTANERDPKDNIWVRVYIVDYGEVFGITVPGTYPEVPEDPPTSRRFETDSDPDDGSADAAEEPSSTPPSRSWRDRDEDGRPDAVDRCPNNPGVEAFDGCPAPDVVVEELDGEPSDLDASHRRFEIAEGVTVFAVPGQVIAGVGVKAKYYLRKEGRWYAFGAASVGYDMEDRDYHNPVDAEARGHPTPETADDFDVGLLVEVGFGVEISERVDWEVGLIGAASGNEKSFHHDQRSLLVATGPCFELGRFQNTQICAKAAAGFTAWPEGNGESGLAPVAGLYFGGFFTAPTEKQKAIREAERLERRSERRAARRARRGE